ncbi:MAG: hypothetical protein JRJ54_11265 [Deltaproteobacteria bacterium]|nr:hypothetical protein [Deltaproteobacteria bacterium]
MVGVNPIEQMHPALQEKSLEEMGVLIGEPLELADESFSRGPLETVFSPPKKKAVVVDFRDKGGDPDRVHLLMDLEAAVALAGRLIMLPAEEIRAARKRGDFDGELWDAFSEIANILTGVINETWQETISVQKRHFIKDEIRVWDPKAPGPPVLPALQNVFSGRMVLKDESLGAFFFFFPQNMIPEQASMQETTLHPAPDSVQEEAESVPETPNAAAETGSATPHVPETGEMSQEEVDALLIRSLEPTAEELQSLLGNAVVFENPSTGSVKKSELFSGTREKQVLTHIRAAGDTEGRAYMLFPLKDAIYFGALLLMMPAEAIDSVVKQGKFDGEIADAFGEIANILVGCYTNGFQTGLPFPLKLIKDRVETLSPAQVDPASREPFDADVYQRIDAPLRLGDRKYGPMVLLFPRFLLRLPAEAAPPEAAAKGETPAAPEGAGRGPGQGRIISIIGDDSDQLEALEKIISEEDVALARHPMDTDFKEAFGRKHPDCVFLFINRVNDQGLAKAIKVRAALQQECPLIVGGPQWTKSLVFKARKYGVNDILVTPADKEVIRKKCRKYL